MVDAALIVARPRPWTSSAFRRLWRLALIGAGAAVIVAGFLIAPLPGPFGLPIAVLGLMLVLRHSYGARRGFVRLQRRHPKFVYPLRRIMRRWQSIAPVMWRVTLTAERFVLRRWRFLAKLRRAARRRG